MRDGKHELVIEAEKKVREVFDRIEETAFVNQARVLEAFQRARVREHHFHSSTGYGYNDTGREVLESIYAAVFGGEGALVRSQIISGTHALSLCLFALLRPGDELVSACGRPYDTLVRVIGAKGQTRFSLVERGINYREVALTPEGKIDVEALGKALTSKTRVVLIQRSRGYSWRPALSTEDIRRTVRAVKDVAPHAVCLVDNCYGEFTDPLEPSHVGADLTVGSLIKNPGGGLAPGGGYVVGREELIEQVAAQLTAPGLGKEVGPSMWDKRLVYQGLFIAPHVVGEALKGAVLAAYIMEALGYEVSPRWDEPRGDIVQAIKLDSPEKVRAFCQAVQASSPVDSDVRLEYSVMPAYEDEIVMAAGTFVQGSSIELSCDGPRRSPFVAYLQGGLTYQHVRYALLRIMSVM
ncbi:aminotransferase class I/II-fold pyridoxal phosphate-dependent enzyme [Syntrophothermus lipocalidus]|uniref:Aluminum resistance family protein n=1 Tax=Syntrophothermus lipocalidus (strain DSM 12680 / TGB-C1) TaxID=643648 RepID=D7CMC4_SYNLT|nr:methionine gamma-lyase family protein [Syntrophothermus lipocalidus]ADI01859.1 Aluminum resistance family protein [Syntrophothermus lipocalidus DSM 12680]